MLTYNGKRYTFEMASAVFGISKSTLIRRKNKLKWSDEKTITTPVNETLIPNKNRRKRKGDICMMAVNDDFNECFTCKCLDCICGTTTSCSNEPCMEDFFNRKEYHK